MKKRIFLLTVLATFLTTPAFAKPWFRRNTNVTYAANQATYAEASTAQGVANIMARQNAVGHFGGNSGYEGCGMADTPEKAYNMCCYANSGLTTIDVGYAQGSNGMWFCCRRYQ